MSTGDQCMQKGGGFFAWNSSPLTQSSDRPLIAIYSALRLWYICMLLIINWEYQRHLKDKRFRVNLILIDFHYCAILHACNVINIIHHKWFSLSADLALIICDLLAGMIRHSCRQQQQQFICFMHVTLLAIFLLLKVKTCIAQEAKSMAKMCLSPHHFW